MNAAEYFFEGDVPWWARLVSDETVRVVEGDGNFAPQANEVLGWRLFKARGGMLFPLAHNVGTAWTVEVSEAACALGHSHPKPARDCSCGFYGFRDVAEAVKQGRFERDACLAAVAYSGTFMPHGLGFRSSHARILAVAVMQDDVAAVQSRYPTIAIFPLTLRDVTMRRGEGRGIKDRPADEIAYAINDIVVRENIMVWNANGVTVEIAKANPPLACKPKKATAATGPCNKCGVDDRYPNGACAPCKRAASARHNAKKRAGRP